MTDYTDNLSSFTTGNNAPGNKATGNKITADTFTSMVNLVESLLNHNHIFTDDYYSNCQCACGRGVL